MVTLSHMTNFILSKVLTYIIFLALFTNQPAAKVPYATLRRGSIVGLPEGANLVHPSMMSVNLLNYIKDNVSRIHFVGTLQPIFLCKYILYVW